MDEQAQVQAIVDGAQAVAEDMSLAGQHAQARAIVGLVQLVRVLWTRLQPAKPAEEPPA